MSIISASAIESSLGYQISRSVRLRSSASAYFNRTPASAGNRKTWTWSGWVKRGTLGALQGLFEATPGGFNLTSANIQATGEFSLQLYSAPTYNTVWSSSAVFRDPSAWYHIVFSLDTTEASLSNTVKLYVNGVQQTLSYVNYNSAPPQNGDWFVNATTSTHRIGLYNSGNPFDGYLTEINFIDGQALTPSSFGQNNPITGVWEPKQYTGTYGTNGFYLNFSDPSAATAAAIGKDYSGNGNNWTPNNISVTAGVTYDSMIDTPTPYADGGNGRGNYCTLNPLDKYNTNGTISDGNLAFTSGNVIWFAGSTMAISTKMYTEITVTAKGTNDSQTCGIAETGLNTATLPLQWNWSISGNRLFLSGVASGVTMPAVVANDVIGFAVDPTAKTCAIFLNNSLITTATYTTSKDVCIFVANGFTNGNWSGVINFGQRPFAYTPPTGFKALNTQNLPEPTISNGAQYMAATLWTGTQAARTIDNSVNGVSFQPDFIWTKSRSNAESHRLSDSVRGGNGTVLYTLLSNDTAAEGADTDVSGFATNGFTIRAGTNSPNVTGRTYVGWQWKAGGTPAVTNTAGSITSTVSAGVTQGFSVVTYTGTGAVATVGHGLGVAPAMVIVKNRSAGATGWPVYHKNATASPATGGLRLNLTDGFVTYSPYWNNTAPTSSVFTVGAENQVNGNGNSMVAYCFAEVPGFSRFGSYTGNGSADGPFVFCGFRPRFVLYKRTDVSGTSWGMIDTARNTFNLANASLYANVSDAEYTTLGSLDFVSNGFKIRSSDTNINSSGNTFIFAAFAENPFKNALAR